MNRLSVLFARRFHTSKFVQCSASASQKMADYKVDGSVAVITLKNPPVNALGKKLRHDFRVGLEKAERDVSVKAVILTGAGPFFCAGADISEFEDHRRTGAQTGTSLIDLLDALDSLSKPVVAAINGACLGGGLEVALTTHYRIADSSAKLGFPEVSLGILPGAQGTQRLPRLIGVAGALRLITTGRPVSAKEALKLGIVDKVVERGVLSAAKQLALSAASKPLAPRRVSSMTIKDAAGARKIVEETIAQLKRRNPNEMAPVLCAQAVGAAADLNWKAGIARERELFGTLQQSGEAKAKQYLFFAERVATKWVVPGRNTPINPRMSLGVKRAGVIGSGTMGTGIAVSLLSAGVSVVLIEKDRKFLERGVAMIKDVLKGGVKRGKMTQDQMSYLLTGLQPSLSYSDLKDVDLVVEAVFENLAIKQEVFQQLDKHCPARAILASNTSTISIDKIAAATSRPEKVVGMHYFAPAYIMKLLEVIRGTKSSEQAIATACMVGKLTGKTSVLVNNCDGFVANRMRNGFHSEAMFLLEEGCLPQDVDRVMEDFGFPMGPLKVSDLSGLDIGAKIRKEAYKAEGVVDDSNTRYLRGVRISRLSDALVDAGRLGRKTGAGFYRYERVGGRNAMPDEFVTRTITEYSERQGITRRVISPQEMFERLMLPWINEGFRCLEEGIAARPQDIDVINLYGFGFPRSAGGPMFMAQQMGLRLVVDRMAHYQALNPTSPHWLPSHLLLKLAAMETQPPMDQWASFGTPHLFGNL